MGYADRGADSRRSGAAMYYTSKQRLWLATPSGSGSLSGAAPETPVSLEGSKDGIERRSKDGA